MKITVIGLWHLGVVTGTCLSKRHEVTLLELGDPANLERLRLNTAPLNEPGISDLMAWQRAKGKLHLSYSAEALLSHGTDVLWVCHDLPVSDDGSPEPESVLTDIRTCLRWLPANRLVILSTQFPVGTCAKLEAEFPEHRFAVIPENLRIGRAVESWDTASRVIVGSRDKKFVPRPDLMEILDKLPGTPEIVSPESAEMTKHALNGFLALSICYANEISRICEDVGANAQDVMRGVMSDGRVGLNAYLRPGKPFTGWTLVRDVRTLEYHFGRGTLIVQSIIPANNRHATMSGNPIDYGQSKHRP